MRFSTELSGLPNKANGSLTLFRAVLPIGHFAPEAILEIKRKERGDAQLYLSGAMGKEPHYVFMLLLYQKAYGVFPRGIISIKSGA